MSPQQRAVDASFLHHGIEAVLDPDGAARPVRLLVSQPDEGLRFEGVQLLDETGVFEIRRADFDGFGDLAVLDVGGERRKVQSHRVRDPWRLKVTLDTVPA